MDEAHLGAALRYVALNPVRAGLARAAADWRWSSARVHLGLAEDDGLTVREPVLSRYPDFAALIAADADEASIMRLRKAETIGRPLGDHAFLKHLEAQAGRRLQPARRGPKPKRN